jgi:hypothetical protein
MLIKLLLAMGKCEWPGASYNEVDCNEVEGWEI